MLARYRSGLTRWFDEIFIGRDTRRLVRGALLVGLILMPTVLAGCFSRSEQHGQLITKRLINEMQPGIHRSADIAALLGSPSAVGAFDDKVWLYVGQRNARYAIVGPVAKERQVLRLTFDEKDVLQKIEHFDLAQGLSVDPTERTTKSKGKKPSLWKQFIGNIGRFNASEQGNTDASP